MNNEVRIISRNTFKVLLSHHCYDYTRKITLFSYLCPRLPRLNLHHDKFKDKRTRKDFAIDLAIYDAKLCLVLLKIFTKTIITCEQL
jgi:hypothetical protein